MGITPVIHPVHHHSADSQHAVRTGAVGFEVHCAHQAFFFAELRHAEIEAEETASAQARCDDCQGSKTQDGFGKRHGASPVCCNCASFTENAPTDLRKV